MLLILNPSSRFAYGVKKQGQKQYPVVLIPKEIMPVFLSSYPACQQKQDLLSITPTATATTGGETRSAKSLRDLSL